MMAKMPMPGNPLEPRKPGDLESGWGRGPVRFVIACALIVFIAALWWLDIIPWKRDPDPTQAPTVAYKLIKAGSIDPLDSTPGKIVGHFIVEPDNRPDPQVDRSLGSGGACLIADFGQFMTSSQTCTAHSQCSDNWNDYYESIKSDPKFTEGDSAKVGFTKKDAGYCVQGSCQYRPWVNACARQPTPWADGMHDVTLPSTDFLKKMYGPNVQLNWSVVACANRVSTANNPPTGDLPSCPNSAGIYDPPQS